MQKEVFLQFAIVCSRAPHLASLRFCCLGAHRLNSQRVPGVPERCSPAGRGASAGLPPRGPARSRAGRQRALRGRGGTGRDGAAPAPRGERHQQAERRHRLRRGAVGRVPSQRDGRAPGWAPPLRGAYERTKCCSTSSRRSWAGKGPEQPRFQVSPARGRTRAQSPPKIPPNLTRSMDLRYLHPSKGRCALQLLRCFGTSAPLR